VRISGPQSINGKRLGKKKTQEIWVGGSNHCTELLQIILWKVFTFADLLYPRIQVCTSHFFLLKIQNSRLRRSHPLPVIVHPKMSAETPYGFIGLGIMGRGMALNLLKKGFKVVVWNRSVDKCDELVKGQN
jgi:hypothetical protein